MNEKYNNITLVSTPSLYNVNEKKDTEEKKENINNNSKEPINTNINTDTDDAEGNTGSSKESNRLHKQREDRRSKGFVKANIVTVITTITAIITAFLLQIPIEVALTLWLSTFLIDAIYTYKNREYINYELNYVVRYSKALYNTLLCCKIDPYFQ